MDVISISYLILAFVGLHILSVWIIGLSFVRRLNRVLEKAEISLDHQNIELTENILDTNRNSNFDAGPEINGSDLANGNTGNRTFNLTKSRAKGPGQKSENGMESSQSTIVNLSNSVQNNVGHEQTYLDHYKKGLLCLYQKNHLEAIEYFSRSLAINPDYALAYEYRAEAYIWVGEKDKALADIESSKKLKGD